MSINDDQLHGESDVFGVPTRVGPWALEDESSLAINWRRDLGETDLDPDDGEEKALYEWVNVVSVAEGGAWRAELRKGFEDTSMRDRPQLTQIEQKSHTDEGREAVIEAAIDFMLERGGEAEEDTPDEDEIIAEVMAEQEADEIGRWRRVDVGDVETSMIDEVLVRWQDRDDDIMVVVGWSDFKGDRKYRAKAEAISDAAHFNRSSIKSSAESLETVLDDAIDWMRRHRPGIPLPTFSMRIENGIFQPLANIIRKLGGGKTLIEVRDDSILFESASHVGLVEYRLPASDMESFDVEREGEATVDTEVLWDGSREHNFSEVIPVALDGDDERPRLQVAQTSTKAEWSVAYHKRSLPDLADPDARFTVDGIEWRDKLRAIDIISDEDAVFGRKDGAVFIRVESGDGKDEATARIETTDAMGEEVVLINPDFLQELRKAMPRPSRTPITIALKDEQPMLAEYTVGETDVDVRIALKTGPVPIEISVPPAEVVVPDDATTREPTEPEEEADAMDEFVEQAVEETDTTAATTGIPESVGPFELEENTEDRIAWTIDDGTGVFAERRDGVWVVWVTDDTGSMTRLGATSTDTGAVNIAVEALEGYQRPRDARDAARTASNFAMGKFRRTTGNDITGSPLQALAGHFPSIDAMREASFAEIETISGVGPGTIGSLRENFDIADEPSAVAAEGAIAVEEDPEERFIYVDEFDGEQEFVVAGEVPDSVISEALNAAATAFSDPSAFDTNQRVGVVTYRDEDIIEIDWSRGEDALEADEEEADETITEASREVLVGDLGGAIISAESRLERAEELGLGDGAAAGRVETALEEVKEAHENWSERPPDLPSTKPSVVERVRSARGWLSQLRQRDGELLDVIREEEAGEESEKPLLQDWNLDNDWPNLSSVKTEYSMGRDISESQWQKVEEKLGFTDVADLIRAMIEPGDEYRVEENIQGVEELGREMLTRWIQKNIWNNHDIAEPLSEFFDDPDEVLPALLEMDDYTEIPGIGQAGAEALRDHLEAEYGDEEAEEAAPPDEEPEEFAANVVVRSAGGGPAYDVEGDVPGSVVDEAVGAAIDTFGEAPEFVDGIRVGEVRFRGERLEGIDLSPGERVRQEATGRGGRVTVEPEEEPEPEPEEEAEPEPDDDFGRTIEGTFSEEVIEEGERETEIVDEPEEEPETGRAMSMSRRQIKESIEQATIGTDVSVQVVGSTLREIKIRPEGPDAPQFRGGTETVTTTARDTDAETVVAAITAWQDNIDRDALPADEIESANEMRDLIAERIGVPIPAITQTVPPPEEDEETVGIPYSEEDLEEMVNEAVQGANADATITEGADSLRIRLLVPGGTGVRYEREPMEVQGQATDPIPTVIEAIEEWEDAVALSSIDRELLDDRREMTEEEFGITLPTVARVGEEPAEPGEITDLAEQVQRINQEFQQVPIPTEGGGDVPGFDLPVQVDQQMSEMLDEEGTTSMEQSLEIHHTEDVHDEIHEAIATVLDADPEKFYDSSKPSELPGFDLFYAFDMSRSSPNTAWSNRRFDPSTLFRLLEPFDGNKIQVLARAGPLA